jgi:hypothetical protein
MDMNVKKVITDGWRSPVNVSLKNKEDYFRILGSDILWKLPTPLQAGMSKYQTSQLRSPIDFSAFSAF